MAATEHKESQAFSRDDQDEGGHLSFNWATRVGPWIISWFLVELPCKGNSRRCSEVSSKDGGGGEQKDEEEGVGGERKGEGGRNMTERETKIFAWRNNVTLDRTIKSGNVGTPDSLSSLSLCGILSPPLPAETPTLTTQWYSRKNSCNYLDNWRERDGEGEGENIEEK